MTTGQPNIAAPPEAIRIGIEDGDYVLSAEDLSVLAELMGVRSNPLTLLPVAQPVAGQREALVADFARVDAAHRQRLTIALGMLAAPAKIAYQHQTVADETISRCVLAWSTSVPGYMVALARQGRLRRVSFVTVDAVKASIIQALAAHRKLPEDGIGCQLPSLAVMTFLAVLDQLRAVRVYSLLEHAAPVTSFSPGEIQERLAGAVREDFRWPLNFVDKVLPGLAASITPADVAEAIQALARAQLVEPVVETAQTQRYDLTDNGKIISDEVAHEVTKVALSLCDQRPDGQHGHDLALLIRGPFRVFLFGMAGQQGIVAALNNEELDELLGRALIAPEPAPQPVAAPKFCGVCGHATSADTVFCGNCGASLA